MLLSVLYASFSLECFFLFLCVFCFVFLFILSFSFCCVCFFLFYHFFCFFWSFLFFFLFFLFCRFQSVMFVFYVLFASYQFPSVLRVSLLCVFPFVLRISYCFLCFFLFVCFFLFFCFFLFYVFLFHSICLYNLSYYLFCSFNNCIDCILKNSPFFRQLFVSCDKSF